MTQQLITPVSLAHWTCFAVWYHGTYAVILFNPTNKFFFLAEATINSSIYKENDDVSNKLALISSYLNEFRGCTIFFHSAQIVYGWFELLCQNGLGSLKIKIPVLYHGRLVFFTPLGLEFKSWGTNILIIFVPNMFFWQKYTYTRFKPGRVAS